MDDVVRVKTLRGSAIVVAVHPIRGSHTCQISPPIHISLVQELDQVALDFTRSHQQRRTSRHPSARLLWELNSTARGSVQRLAGEANLSSGRILRWIRPFVLVAVPPVHHRAGGSCVRARRRLGSPHGGAGSHRPTARRRSSAAVIDSWWRRPCAASASRPRPCGCHGSFSVCRARAFKFGFSGTTVMVVPGRAGRGGHGDSDRSSSAEI